ncbi:hypothetical protein KBAD50_00280 [Aeromonas dhakensis]|nr:hypothetical protein KBAD59_00280 [Aeromonas dhakensis]CAD7495634.1 hypothetical protein KBAD50_00280 [Aeromonas dhakensis]
MSRLGHLLAMPRSLGRRLILAFVAITALTGAMGMAAYVMWDRLGRQIHLIVEESLPAIDNAYQLERASSRLLLLLAQLRDTRDPVQYQRLSHAVSTTLRDIQRAYRLGTPGDQETPSQRQAFGELSALVADHGRYLKQQIEHAETLQQLQKRSNWLHQDLVDDAAPLLQEVEWHLTGMVASPDDMSEFGNVIKEFSALQDLTFKENELQSLVGEVIAQRYQQDLESAFLFIGYKIDEIDELTSRLAEYPSTVSYRQILQDIITLVKPDGPLHRLLLADVQTHQQLTALRPRLDDAVSRYHQKVSLMVSDANRSLSALGEDSSQQVATGKLVILVVLALTLLLSIFVLVVLIGRRLIKRLDLLGQGRGRPAGRAGQHLRPGRDRPTGRQFAPLQPAVAADGAGQCPQPYQQHPGLPYHLPSGWHHRVGQPERAHPVPADRRRAGPAVVAGLSGSGEGDAGGAVRGGPAAAPARPQRVHPGLRSGRDAPFPASQPAPLRTGARVQIHHHHHGCHPPGADGQGARPAGGGAYPRADREQPAAGGGSGAAPAGGAHPVADPG